MWLVLTINPTAAQQQSSVYLEDHTWPEVRDKLAAGYTTIIIPTGGTEQNGPHLALGKHNAIVSFTAGEIARNLGNALVAPTLAYVPEGRISPPEGHMRFPGTISVRAEHVAGLLEDAARSFKQHGFTHIVLLGDHGGTQAPMKKVARRLSDEWQSLPHQVLYISDYYKENGQVEWAKKENISVRDLNAHGGFADTSELLATDKRLVRPSLVRPYSREDSATYGVSGDPSKATAQYGQQLLRLKIGAATKQIRGMIR